MTVYAEKNTAIAGIGQSEIERKPTVVPFELAVRACERAIADAGLKPEDIDGAACWPHVSSGVVTGVGCASIPDIAGSLGLKLNWWSSNAVAAQLSPVMEAIAAIAAGYCTHVLVWRAVGERSEQAYAAAFVPYGAFDYMVPYLAPSAANWLACHASTHMERYGITREQLGAIAINQRRNAALNPNAIYRDPITMDDYLGARLVSTPFGLFDCDVPCNASTAFVVSRLDAARDLKRRPIRIEAFGAGSRDRMETWISRADYPHQAMHDASAALWRRTDLKPKDVDVAHIYDGFSWLSLSWLEALGFCKEGESGTFVEGGRRIALDGELPMNTNGGQLSEGRTHGLGHLHEAVLQMRREAGARQVKKDINVSIVANGGGDVGGALLLRPDH
jgi:acetyl-CoA acetyltransferase